MVASSRYQQLDRALVLYEEAKSVCPDDLEIALRCVSTLFLAAGEAKELLASAVAGGVVLVKSAEGVEGIVALEVRAAVAAICGETDQALQGYKELCVHAGAATGYLANARYLARHLAVARGLAADVFDGSFPPLRLVVFSGHLPPRGDAACRKLIAEELAALDAKVGVASAAAGADLLFLDCLHARGGESHVILPWSRSAFRETSILPFTSKDGGEIWGDLFEKALDRSANVREIGEVAGPYSPVAWQYLLEVSAGIAKEIARETHLDILPLAVWDGKPGFPGGTAAFCEFWEKQLNIKPRVITPPGQEENAATETAERKVHRAQSSILQQSVKSMLFVDVVGFSSLSEAVMPMFIETFLQRVSGVVAASSHAPHSINTWGDAVYAVFDFVQDAGRFALELNEMVEQNADEWKALGLGPLQIRTGLHAGPVFLHQDPIVRRLGFSGAHVNRAARIEPIAEPGSIFCSEEFAALAALAPGNGFSLEYVCTRPLAKSYPGLHRLYRLTRDRSGDLLMLAKAIHDDYCATTRMNGATPETNPSLCAWGQLPPILQSSNLAQADDIPHKLRKLGYEIVDSGGMPPSEIVLDSDLVEPLAIVEHERWMAEKMRAGWVYAATRDNEKLHHPLLIPYDELSGEEKDKDRDTVRNIPKLLAMAGYRVKAL